MISGNFPAPPKDGKKEVLQENHGNSSLIINGSLFINNVHNIHLVDVYNYVFNHPWSNAAQIQNGLGYTLVGGRANWRHRVLISDACAILELGRYFKKDYHKFCCTGKVLRLEPAPHNERKFGSDGLPRIQPKSNATMPGYGRPDCGGDGE